MRIPRPICFTALLIALAAVQAQAEPIRLPAGPVTYVVDPGTLAISAQMDGAADVALMSPLHDDEPAQVEHSGDSWVWSDREHHSFTATIDHDALRLVIATAETTRLEWPLAPVVSRDTWLIPDGEGVVFDAGNAFWRQTYAKPSCLNSSGMLSFPAWGHMNDGQAVVYALGDGLQSALCLHDADGVQGGLRHDFSPGSDRLEILMAVHPASLLAPALFYRQLLLDRGQLTTFAAKAVPDLPRLFGAPHSYVWGDGRDLAFLDDLKALGIGHMLIAYDQDPASQKHIAGPAYLARAADLGYLAGPYEEFDNAQPPATADAPYTIWSDDLYPAGCVHDADGKIRAAPGNRGCHLSSEAVARHNGPPSPASRYAQHVAEGAKHVFVDVDAFGNFLADFSPDHPMTMAGDRANRFARLKLGITDYHLVLGSENVTAWSHRVAHYSHGTAQSHNKSVWPLLSDPRMGGFWPPDNPPLFFQPMTLTAAETQALFAPADHLPLFEAVFHDAVVATDRWEFDLFKIKGEEGERFARALLYGTPTMWNLDRAKLKRVGPWLKATHDDFRTAHGWDTPVALTGFAWLSEDRRVQQATYGDGRVLIANFSPAPWQGLGNNCVRVKRPGEADIDLCPPPPLP